MQTFLTTITAASLLLHTVFGCCTHGDRGPCACRHDALGGERRAHDHADAGHADACGHAGHGAHRGHDDHGRDAGTTATTDRGDGSWPACPGRCHCDGSRCHATASSPVRVVDAPAVSFDVLPPLGLAGGIDVLPAARRAFVGEPIAAPALPLRAHLLYQSLLI